MASQITNSGADPHAQLSFGLTCRASLMACSDGTGTFPAQIPFFPAPACGQDLAEPAIQKQGTHLRARKGGRAAFLG